MKKLTRNQFLVISLMLFSLFFGSGNLIFPPMTGKLAGESMFSAMSFFSITAVLLPLLGVVAVAKSDGLSNLAGRVSPWFAVVFTIVIYLSIGPLMGVPRAGSTPFEMLIAPKIESPFLSNLALFIYTFIFFSITYLVSLNPKRMTQTVGKYLTPGIIILMIVLFIASLLTPIGAYSEPLGAYVEHPHIQGFLDGYMTMDTMGALNFGLVVVLAIKAFDIVDKKHIASSAIKAGCVAGSILIIIYFMLAHLGAQSASIYPETTNGAQILALASTHVLGDYGTYLMGAMFTLACLTTSIGLIVSCSEYFSIYIPRVSYRGWVAIWTVVSLLLANIGLDSILKYNKPLLTAFYPMAIVLIVLSLIDRIIKDKGLVYKLTIYTTGFVCIVDALAELGFSIPYLTRWINQLPFSSINLGWVVPALLLFSIGMFITLVRKAK